MTVVFALDDEQTVKAHTHSSLSQIGEPHTKSDRKAPPSNCFHYYLISCCITGPSSLCECVSYTHIEFQSLLRTCNEWIFDTPNRKKSKISSQYFKFDHTHTHTFTYIYIYQLIYTISNLEPWAYISLLFPLTLLPYVCLSHIYWFRSDYVHIGTVVAVVGRLVIKTKLKLANCNCDLFYDYHDQFVVSTQTNFCH